MIGKEKLVTIGKPNWNGYFLLKISNPDWYYNPREIEDIAAVFKVIRNSHIILYILSLSNTAIPACVASLSPTGRLKIDLTNYMFQNRLSLAWHDK